jgi:hypothetical protein
MATITSGGPYKSRYMNVALIISTYISYMDPSADRKLGKKAGKPSATHRRMAS